MPPAEVRVVVTGLGLISPLGLNVRESVDNAFNGASGIRQCSWSGALAEGLNGQVGGNVLGFEPERFMKPEFAKRYDRMNQLAIATSFEAIGDADLRPGAFDPERFGCCIGGAAPSSSSWQAMVDANYREVGQIPSYWGPSMSGNMAAALVSLTHDLRGPSLAVSNACSTGSTAISVAADKIRLGLADQMIAGGSEAALNAVMNASFGNLKAIHVTNEPLRASRPFSIDRCGFVLAEGCGLVVLESFEHAKARGARIYAELVGAGETNDAFHLLSPDPTGKRWAKTMQIALAAAGLPPESVDYVSAHAASTPMGDLAENSALKLTFGKHASRLLVSATKSMHGHAFGASPAMETVLALAAMSENKVLPTINMRPDPACDLNYVGEHGENKKTQVLLKNSFGIGGASTTLIFSRDIAAAKTKKSPFSQSSI